MTRRNQYATGVAVIIPLRLVASFMLMMRLLGAEDPGLPIGEIATYVDGHEMVSYDPNYKGKHQGEFPPVPVWLKTANVIAMPVLYILPEDWFKGLPDSTCYLLHLLEFLISGVLWGSLIVFIFRLVAR